MQNILHCCVSGIFDNTGVNKLTEEVISTFFFKQIRVLTHLVVNGFRFLKRALKIRSIVCKDSVRTDLKCTTSNTGCNRRNGSDFGRVFLMLNYTEKPQNTYIKSSMVTEI
jgi:hypothetical protein